MATTILATCPVCGDVRLRTGDVSVVGQHVGPFDVDHRLVFRCPDCRQLAVRLCQADIVDRLREAGVVVAVVRPRSDADDLGPLCPADLERFTRLLGREDFVARLVVER